MAVIVLGPAGDPKVAKAAETALARGDTVVVWGPSGTALEALVAGLPVAPPGRLATWTGGGDDPALAAFVAETLDRGVK